MTTVRTEGVFESSRDQADVPASLGPSAYLVLQMSFIDS